MENNKEEIISIEEDKIQESALTRLYDYFINEKYGDPIPFGAWEKFSSVLMLIGASSGIYSWPAAWQYAKDKNPLLKYSITISNPLSSVLFLAKATDDLFDTIGTELKKPEPLVDILVLPAKSELVAKYSKMLAGSVICAVPFAIAVYLFPLPNCNEAPCLITTVTHSLLANTILHAISWNLILTPQFWYYRLPTLPFEKAYSHAKKRYLTQIQRHLLEIEQQKDHIYRKYKNILSQFFASGIEKIVDDYLKNRQSPTKLQDYRALKNNDSNLINFITLAEREKHPDELHPPSCLARVGSSINSVLSNGVVGFVGATFMIVGCSGWVANPFYLALKEGLNLIEAIFAGILPSYSTTVLCAFYGSAVANQIYQYLTSWSGNCSDKFSVEARLYPKTFAVFLIINTYMAIFAFGNAQTLTQAVFGDEMWDDYRPYLLGISIPALQLLSFVPLAGLFNAVMRKTIGKFGQQSDDQYAARLLTKSVVMIQRLQQMNGEQLMHSLETFSPDQQKALGVDYEQFTNDLQSLNNLAIEKENTLPQLQNTSGVYTSFSFFRLKQGPQKTKYIEKQPLLETSASSVNYMNS